MKSKLCGLTLTTAMAMAFIPGTFGSTAPTAQAAGTVTGQMVVNEAMRYLHYKYAYTGSSPKTGFSCIGFVWYVFQSLGINMPGDLGDAIAKYQRVSENDLRPGDIVFFQNTWWKGVSHVAIYIGDGKIIHAENPQRGVNIDVIRNDPVEGTYWQQHYLVGERPLASNNYTPSPPPTSKPTSYVRVSVPSLNLRSQPSLNAGVETVLSQGDRLGVIGSQAGWYQIQTASGLTGWVIEGGVTPADATHGTSSGSGWHGFPGTVVVQGLNVHTDPAVSASVMESLNKGIEVRVMKRKSGWDKVKLADGNRGWSLAWGIKVDGKTKPVGHQPKHARQYTVASGVRIHKSPELSAPVVAYTDSGMTVSVSRQSGEFAKVKTSTGTSGWMDSSFINGFTPQAPTERHHHTVVRRATLNVTAHLRTGPSLTATILRWVPAGTKLSVLKTVPEWDKVRLSGGGKTGYIWSAFIS